MLRPDGQLAPAAAGAGCLPWLPRSGWETPGCHSDPFAILRSSPARPESSRSICPLRETKTGSGPGLAGAMSPGVGADRLLSR